MTVVGLALQHRLAVFHDRIDHQKFFTCSQIAFEIAARLAQRIAAELFQKCLREDDGHHRLADNTRGRHHANVAALVGCQRGLARRQIHRFSGRRSVEIGFRNPRTRMSCPFVIPPSRPPARFAPRVTRAAFAS